MASHDDANADRGDCSYTIRPLAYSSMHGVTEECTTVMRMCGGSYIMRSMARRENRRSHSVCAPKHGILEWLRETVSQSIEEGTAMYAGGYPPIERDSFLRSTATSQVRIEECRIEAGKSGRQVVGNVRHARNTTTRPKSRTRGA